LSTPNPNATRADVAQDFRFVARALGLGRFGILARSGGTDPAVEYARQYPEDVSGMALFSPVVPTNVIAGWMHGMTEDNQAKHTAARQGLAALEATMAEHATALQKDKFDLLRRLWPDLHSSDPASMSILYDCYGYDEMAWSHQAGVAEDGKGWAHATMRFAEPLDLNVAAPTAPTLLIRGTDDPFVSARHAEWLNHHLPDSVFLEVPGASHFISLPLYPFALDFLRDMHHGEGTGKRILDEMQRLIQEDEQRRGPVGLFDPSDPRYAHESPAILRAARRSVERVRAVRCARAAIELVIKGEG